MCGLWSSIHKAKFGWVMAYLTQGAQVPICHTTQSHIPSHHHVSLSLFCLKATCQFHLQELGPGTRCWRWGVKLPLVIIYFDSYFTCSQVGENNRNNDFLCCRGYVQSQDCSVWDVWPTATQNIKLFFVSFLFSDAVIYTSCTIHNHCQNLLKHISSVVSSVTCNCSVQFYTTVPVYMSVTVCILCKHIPMSRMWLRWTVVIVIICRWVCSGV